MKQKENYLVLDAIRGIAALLVFIGHLRAIVFTNLDSTTVKSIIGKAFLFITGFGHEAVVIFFVLSGFFIAKTVDADLQKGTWTFKKYFLDRAIRLWVVLLPALILGGMLDKIGLYFFANEITYKGGITFLPDVNPATKIGFVEFFGNLFFVQTIFTQTWGSNGPLWSLANEFWYYKLYALFILAYVARKKIATFIIAVSAILIVMFFTFHNVLLYFLIWLLGVGVYYFRKKYFKKTTLLTLLAYITTIIILTLIRLQFMPAVFNDFSLSIIIALLIYTNAYAACFSSVLTKIVNWLSNISYSLYLVHMPICLFIATAFHKINLGFNNINLLYWLLIFSLILTIVTFLWYLFERNTNKIKKVVNSFLDFKVLTQNLV